jgi:hypothetical protein
MEEAGTTIVSRHSESLSHEKSATYIPNTRFIKQELQKPQSLINNHLKTSECAEYVWKLALE